MKFLAMTAMKAPEANQIIARPAASMNAQVNATLAPPSLSGAWPKTSRVATKAAANALNVSQTGLHARSVDSKELKAIIAPKPTVLKAAPIPGSQTWDKTLINPVGEPCCAGMEGNQATVSTARSGRTIVITATAMKPPLA